MDEVNRAHKKHIKDNRFTGKEREKSKEMAEPEELKHQEEDTVSDIFSELDKLVVKAIKYLLKQIRDDIKNLCSEVKQDIMECTKL